MTYSIIGSGKLGTALARQFARNGIEFGLANTRGPDTLTALAQELGKTMIAQSLQEALKADIVILAIPFKAHREIGLSIADWKNRIVIDAMNTYGVSPEELGRLTSWLRRLSAHEWSKPSISCQQRCWLNTLKKMAGAE
jgi:predicted dinucleotide-binding enzyme